MDKKPSLLNFISAIRSLLIENDSERIWTHEIELKWYFDGCDFADYDYGLIDEYRCRSDHRYCNFRGWIDKTDEDIYRELTA